MESSYNVENLIDIPLEEVEFSPSSYTDPVGKVFLWQDRIFRAVENDSVEFVRNLLDSGLIDRLVEKNLFPKTHIAANYKLDRYATIVEHKRIPVVTYPFEWSFEMVKDAALALLEVNEIASEFGYQLKDGHGFNIIFDGIHPKFVDLGSFAPEIEGRLWRGYDECVRFFYYPLKIWADGNEFLARQILSSGSFLPRSSYWNYQYPITKRFPTHLMDSASRLFTKVVLRSPSQIREKFPNRKGEIISLVREKAPILRLQGDLCQLRDKISSLKMKEYKSKWGDYHDTLVDKYGKPDPSPRFERICQLVTQMDNLHSVVEIAGNQGSFSRFLLSNSPLKKVICTDYDPQAIDKLYNFQKQSEEAVVPVLLNIARPTILSDMELPQTRLRADAVIALAVTHHLLLTQKIQIDVMLSKILEYSNRYIFVEFMPLGLFNGQRSLPIPDWYNLEWFKAACERHFNIVFEEQLEVNRILLVGEK